MVEIGWDDVLYYFDGTPILSGKAGSSRSGPGGSFKSNITWGFQIHHIFPLELFDHSELGDLLRELFSGSNNPFLSEM